MKILRTIARTVATGIAAAAAGYATIAAITWVRYGAPRRFHDSELLDFFLPDPEVVERHQTSVAAPCAFTYAAACATNLQSSPIIRAIIGTRKFVLGGLKELRNQPERIETDLIAESQAMGWGILAQIADHEIVLGAVTQPWVANPTFHALSPDEFSSFKEPGWVKIVWNLRAVPLGNDKSVFITETRVATTDTTARTKFRRYWSLVSPGVWVIRRLLLGPVRRDAEQRFLRAARTTACRS